MPTCNSNRQTRFGRLSFRRLRSQRGVSVLEIMIAMVILSLSLLLLLNMAVVALDANDWSNKSTVATQALQDKLEEIRSTLNFTAGADSVGAVARSWNAVDLSTHLKQVNVTVNWTDVRNKAKTNSMSALVRVD